MSRHDLNEIDHQYNIDFLNSGDIFDLRIDN